ncbi:DUF3857 domain-containing protein [uncultured Psychroserpens sp.]|uniref:DUF3857 domain-containing protein n=1 Tax=uncultured Psychroserpens sp. TaxID=255436 RepID=UPI002625D968|nr:DUF3857 domain-containing protein [uncultured Psychroserpens sp.]
MKYLKLILLLLVTNTYAQTDNFALTFEVTRPDIELNHYAKDSTANAVLIYEKGHSFVDNNSFNLNTKVKSKLKILNRNGYEHANVSILIYDNKKGSREKVKDINATVYNIENGKVVKTFLKQSDIFEERYNDNYKFIKFAFPNIKEGSVVNFSYTIESPLMYKYKGWNFQSDIPTMYSEYLASIPGNWEYNVKLVGGQKLVTNSMSLEKRCLTSGTASANCSVSRYVMVDIPAFIEEDFMTTKNNYLSRVEYELKVFRSFNGSVDNITKTWETTDREIERDTDLGQQLKKISAVKKLVGNNISQNTDELEKAKMILEFVQDNYTWNESFRVLEGISIKDLLKDKSGNVGEINALLHNLLVANEINAKPILLSTRQNGFATKLYPVVSDFNYLIVKVDIDGKTYLLDATDEFLNFGQIPFRCLNGYGRLLDFKNGSQWYDIESNGYSLEQYSYDLDFNDEQVLKGTVDFKLTGYHSLFERRAYFKNPSSYEESLSNSHTDLEFSDFKTIDTERRSADFNTNFHIEMTPEVIGDVIYINPFLFKFFKENPFKLQERSYPIDFGYKDAYVYRIKINMADSYQIKELPEPINLRLPGNKGSFLFSTQQQDNSITLYFKLSFNESIYPSEYYESLKQMLAQVVDVQNNALIVLEKKQ